MDSALVTPLPPTRSNPSAPARARDGDEDAFPQILDLSTTDNALDAAAMDAASARSDNREHRTAAKAGGGISSHGDPATAMNLEAQSQVALAPETKPQMDVPAAIAPAPQVKTLLLGDATLELGLPTRLSTGALDVMQGQIALQLISNPPQLVAAAPVGPASIPPTPANDAAMSAIIAAVSQERAPPPARSPQTAWKAEAHAAKSTGSPPTGGANQSPEKTDAEALDAAAFIAELAPVQAEISSDAQTIPMARASDAPSSPSKPQAASAPSAPNPTGAGARPASPPASETLQPEAAIAETPKPEPQPAAQAQVATSQRPGGTEPVAQTQIATNGGQARDASAMPLQESATSSDAPAGDVSTTDTAQGAPSAHSHRGAANPTMQAASHILRRFDGRSSTFEVRLDPAELGRVDVRLEVGADRKVKATLAAERQTTLAELVRASRDLERALSESGLEIAENGVTFSLADGGRDDFANSDERHGRQAQSTGAAAQSETADATPRRAASPVTLSRWSGARLDVWA